MVRFLTEMSEAADSTPRPLDRLEGEAREHAIRVAVYATAAGHRLGIRGRDLRALRIAAEGHDLADSGRADASSIAQEVIRAAKWFDLALHGSQAPRPLSDVASEFLTRSEFSPEVVQALLDVQPLIQPVGT